MTNINSEVSFKINSAESSKPRDQQPSLACKVCKLAIKILCIVTTCKVVFFIKIIPAGSLRSFSGSAPCVYTKDFFCSAASAILSQLRGRKTIFLGLSKELMQSIRTPVPEDQFRTCSSIVCENTVESFQWKKDLIEAAEHNIVLSGNYCGGKAFDEILSVIAVQLEKKPKLQVIVLSSDRFINKSNYEKINCLTKSYSDRFQLIKTPDIWTTGEKAKFSTNHSKILSIDYGKYFILGGSGIEDKYAYHDGLNGQQSSSPNQSGWLSKFLPRDFQDQDFVFHCKEGYEGIGGRVHLKTLQLAYAWMHYNKSSKNDTVVEKVLLDQALDRPQPIVHTSIDRFDQNPSITEEIETKILFMGPEDKNNVFAQELINLFDQAKTQIVIDHMYFHPSQEVFNALVNAANRGVPIKLITNGYDKHSPLSHKAFGPRNRFNYITLRDSVDKEYRENIEIYEFKSPKTTLHKKVIVVDDTVIAGSSNFGYKSLITNSDHEMNFIAKSASFAEQTLKAIAVDCEEEHAKLNSNVQKLTIPELVRVASHSLNAFLIG